MFFVLIRAGSQSKGCASTNEHGFTAASALCQMGCLYHRQLCLSLSQTQTKEKRKKEKIFCLIFFLLLNYSPPTRPPYITKPSAHSAPEAFLIATRLISNNK